MSLLPRKTKLKLEEKICKVKNHKDQVAKASCMHYTESATMM